MMQSNGTTTSIFRTSLRDWKAQWKARQSESGESAAKPPVREKKLVAYKRRKRKQLANQPTQG